MGALLTALLPILGLITAYGSTTIFAGLTLAQWTAIAAALINLDQPAIQAEIAKLHPIFAQLIADAKEYGPQTAAQKAQDNATRVAFSYEDPANHGL